MINDAGKHRVKGEEIVAAKWWNVAALPQNAWLSPL
jgi:hypothetical protein